MEHRELLKRDKGDLSLSDGQLVLIPPGFELSAETASQEQETHLWDHILLVWRRRWLVSTIFLACVGVTTFITLRITPMYYTHAKLRIESEDPDVVQLPQMSAAAAASNTKLDFIQTQIEMIQNRGLARQVVKRLDLKFWGEDVEDPSRLMKLWWSAKDRIEDLKSRVQKMISGPPPAPGSINTDGQANAGETFDMDFELRVDEFLSRLSIDAVPDTEIVLVGFEDEDPRRAATVANALCNEFIGWAYQQRFDSYEGARTWLKEKIDELKGKFDKSEEDLLKLDGGKFLLPLSGDSEKYMSQLESIRQEMTAAEKTTYEKEFELKRYQSGSDFDVLRSSNAQVQRLLDDYAAAEVKLDELRQKLGPEMPAVKQAVAVKARLETQLKEERDRAAQKAKFDFNQAKSQSDFLRKKYESERKEVDRYQQGLLSYNILKREVEVNREVYNSLQQRWRQVSLASSLKAGNISILDPAVPPIIPKSPNKKRNLIFGTALGLLLGIGLALFLEYMDTTVRDAGELKRVAHLDTLGYVPRFDQKFSFRRSRVHVELATHSQPGSYFAESIRSLRTSIQYSLPGRPPKTILVTSCLAGEGKTTVAINLAIAFAQRNKSVLLIDASLKNPSLQKFFKLDTSMGLTEVLTGKFDGANFFEIDVGNLFVLPSGSNPPNPVELLDSDLMRQFLKMAAKEYDHIIIDSAPMLVSSDTSVLAPYVDGVILVVQPGKTPRAAVRNVRDRLVALQGRVLGAVLNNPSRHPGMRDAYRFGVMHGAAQVRNGSRSTPDPAGLVWKVNADSDPATPATVLNGPKMPHRRGAVAASVEGEDTEEHEVI